MVLMRFPSKIAALVITTHLQSFLSQLSDKLSVNKGKPRSPLPLMFFFSIVTSDGSEAVASSENEKEE